MLFEWLHVDFNFDSLAAASEADALYGRNIGVVAPPGQSDVAVGDDQIVGGIKADPSVSRKENRNPGVRSLSTLHFGSRAHISADVARGKTLGTYGSDHDVRKILANTPAMFHHFRQSGADRCGLRAVL